VLAYDSPLGLKAKAAFQRLMCYLPAMYAVVMSVGISGVASISSVNIYLPPLLFRYATIASSITAAFVVPVSSQYASRACAVSIVMRVASWTRYFLAVIVLPPLF